MGRLRNTGSTRGPSGSRQPRLKRAEYILRRKASELNIDVTGMSTIGRRAVSRHWKRTILQQLNKPIAMLGDPTALFRTFVRLKKFGSG